jgi:hypothetical protein
MKYDNVSEVGYFAIEWTNQYSGNTYQLVNRQDTMELILNHRGDSGRLWFTSQLDPMVINMSTPPRTFEEFETLATSFIQ